MSSFDKQYQRLVKNILNNGFLASNRTVDRTKKVFGEVLYVDLQKEFPLLTVKHTPIRTLVKEMLWIYQQQSNDVTWLQNRNVRIWNEWVDENNTIGEAYGAQIKKHNQMDNLIYDLKNKNQSRRMMINLWQNADLHKMQLTPCMFNSIWDVNNGFLNTHVTIRSSDVALGLPFNVAQMAVLNLMLAQVSNLKAGKMIFAITNAHLYEHHLEPISTILNREPYKAPTVKLNKKVTDFYSFADQDVILENYQSHPKISMRVSI